MSVTTRREVILSEGWAEGLWGDLSISSEGMVRRGWIEVMAWNFQSHCPNNIPGSIWEQCPTNQLVKNILDQEFQLKKKITKKPKTSKQTKTKNQNQTNTQTTKQKIPKPKKKKPTKNWGRRGISPKETKDW